MLEKQKIPTPAIPQIKLLSAEATNSTVKIPLILEDWQKRSIDKKLVAQGMIYNACLSYLLKGLNKARQNPDWKEGKKNYKLLAKYGLTKFDTIRIAKEAWHKSDNKLLDGLPTNQTAIRAFKAVEDYINGSKGKPKFKDPHKLNSVYGSGNKQNLRLLFLKKDSYAEALWKESFTGQDLENIKEIKDLNKVILSWTGRETPKRKRLYMRVDWYHISRPRREHLIQKFREGKLVQSGIKRELIRGKVKYSLLLTLKSDPYRAVLSEKPKGSLAIDSGPLNSWGIDDNNKTIQFTPSKEDKDKFAQVEAKIRRKQRALDRSLRNSNPTSYNPDGTLKKETKLTNRSNNAKSLKEDLNELHRKRAALQKVNTTRLVKELTSRYKSVYLEKVNYANWKRLYGKSMRMTTPGLFQTLLSRELNLRGGSLTALPLNYAYSQSCLCGNKVKKTSKDYHTHYCQSRDCPTLNRKLPRDYYSALLILLTQTYNLTPDDLHDVKFMSKFYRSLSKKERTTIEQLLTNLSEIYRSHLDNQRLVEMTPKKLVSACYSSSTNNPCSLKGITKDQEKPKHSKPEGLELKTSRVWR